MSAVPFIFQLHTAIFLGAAQDSVTGTTRQ
jgi:hypothetical protein